MQWLFSFSSFFVGGGHELYVKVLLRTLGRGGGGRCWGGGGGLRGRKAGGVECLLLPCAHFNAAVTSAAEYVSGIKELFSFRC